MDLQVEGADVWAATIPDRPGRLDQVLSVLRDAGADLKLVVARRTREGGGEGIVFVAPLQGDSETRAAAQAGFNVTPSLRAVRVTGKDRPGVIAELTQKLAEGGLNLRGVTATVLGTEFGAYMALDSLSDADRAMEILQKA